MKIVFPFLFVILFLGCKNKLEPSSPASLLSFVDSEFYAPEEAKARRIYSLGMEGAFEVNGPVDSMYQYYIQSGQKTIRHISYFENGLETKRRDFISPQNYSDTYFDYGAEKRFQVSSKVDTSHILYYKNGKLDRKVFSGFVVKNISNGMTDSLAYPNSKNGDVITFDKNGFPLRSVNYAANIDTERMFTWKDKRILSYHEKRIKNGNVISSKYIKWERGNNGLTEHITLFDSLQGEERESTVEYKVETKENGVTGISPIIFGRVNNTYIFDKYGNWIKNIYPISGIEHTREYFYQN